MSQHHKIQLSIVKKPYDRPIHFKVDGKRFDQERTVKFNVNAKYIVNITVTPPLIIEQLTMMGAKLEVDEMKRTDEEVAVFRAEMVTSGLTKDIKGSRQKFPIQIQFKNTGEMLTNFQCKFYGEHETQHTCWGNPLNHIEYDVHLSEGRFIIEAEHFR
ncbi:hypothetical protein HELRODRAFT_184880 [Helobdella robusta]|uniref:CB1 cannabinoid receptor-interacting protein 1 n=1 Tax=Helobdella robusta TaxID=6412 RepID=T1FM45_HELRO|nr:hypothetical protein HELRODRAFT_184880 [Helobdella robusta]ESO13198.1 hypothetical protein HELRODRAFT_184880 [Helobdella robusta]